MADKKTDHSAYHGYDAKLIRGIDATQNGVKGIWEKVSFNRGAGGALLATVGCAVVATPFTVYQEIEEHQQIPTISIAVDYDLSAKGLHNQTYSYVKYNDGENTPIYLLIQDEGHYELYSWSEDRQQAELIEDQNLAAEIIGQVNAYLSQQSTDTKTRFFPCGTIYEASETSDGNGIIRKEASCKTTQPTQAGLQNAVQFWQEANENFANTPYGPATIIEQPDVNDFKNVNAIKRQGQNMLWTMGAWLAFSSIGAGVSGLRRRVERKQQMTDRRL